MITRPILVLTGLLVLSGVQFWVYSQQLGTREQQSQIATAANRAIFLLDRADALVFAARQNQSLSPELAVTVRAAERATQQLLSVAGPQLAGASLSPSRPRAAPDDAEHAVERLATLRPAVESARVRAAESAMAAQDGFATLQWMLLATNLALIAGLAGLVLAPQLQRARRDRRRVDLLQTTAILVSEAESAGAAFDRSIAAILEFTGWEFGCVHEHHQKRHATTHVSVVYELRREHADDALKQLLAEARPTHGQGFVAQAITERESAVTDTLDAEVPWEGAAAQRGYTGGLAVPVAAQGVVFGLLVFFWSRATQPAAETVRLVEGVATQLGRVVERQQAAQANADLAGIVESSANAVLRLDRDGLIRSWNPAAARLYGYSAEEMIDTPVARLLPPSAEPKMADVLIAVGTGGRVEDLETERLHRDGSRVAVCVTATPIHSRRQEVVGIALVERDIRERRRAESRLARFEAIVESSEDAIMAIDPNGVVVSANPASERLLGLKNHEICHVSLRSRFPSERSDAALGLIRRAQAGQALAGHETIWVRGDGTPVEVALTLSPIRSGRGVVTGAAIIARDITAQKEVERRLKRTARGLRRSNEELEKFAYVASHDLKAPMRAIKNLSQWVQEDLGDELPAESATHLELMRGRVVRMEALLDSLLEYSRAGRLRYHPESVETRALLEETLGLVHLPDGFAVEIQAPMPTLLTERVPLGQVFLNLVANAIKHHDAPTGRVRIASTWDAAMATFTVSDDGPGIAPRYHERIFEMFQTLKRRDEVEGTGMGLAIVAKVVKAYGGDIGVQSEGRGTAFVFTWPMVTVAPDHGPGEALA